MKKFYLISSLVLAILFGSAIITKSTWDNRSSYWLELANEAVVNNDSRFIDFYTRFQYDLQTISIHEGWEMYERFCNK